MGELEEGAGPIPALPGSWGRRWLALCEHVVQVGCKISGGVTEGEVPDG